MKHCPSLISTFMFFCLALGPDVFAQKNYLGYYDLINQAEERLVVQNNAPEALKLYDVAFAEYPNPFVKDYYIAAQTALYGRDTTRFLTYVQACFNRGMTWACMDNAKIFAPALADAILSGKLKTLYAERTPPAIDATLRDSVYMRFHREQTFKRHMGRDVDARHMNEKYDGK